MSSPLVPPKMRKDGQWWSTEHLTELECSECGRVFHDRPAAMHYVEDLDHGGDQAQQHPTWPRDGWLLWLECEHCGHQDIERTATDDQIQRWAREVGPWKKLR